MREIVLQDWSPDWVVRFRAERARLERAIGGEVLRIEHVGSTSVPGLAAKPIVDIAIAVASFERFARCVAPLQALGYTYLGEYGIPRRHYFHDGTPRTCQLHVLEETSAAWANHLHFRDALRRQPETARAYETLKRELARRFSPDVEAYADAKSAFVADTLARARAEALPEACVRSEAPGDRAAVRRVNERAFGRPAEADLVERLRERAVARIALVAEQAGRLRGHVLCVPVTLEGAGRSSRALALGPLAVDPAAQRRGLGAWLVRAGLERARALGEPLVFVLGDPAYYARFGFRPAQPLGLRYAGSAPAAAFQVNELEPGARAGRSGLVHYPPEFDTV